MLGGTLGRPACVLHNAELAEQDVDDIKEQIAGGVERIVIQQCKVSVSSANRLGSTLCYPYKQLRLHQLDLSGTQLPEVQCRGIVQALRIQPCIERLSLSCCGVDDQGGQIAMLIDSTKLRHFLASHNNFSASGAQLSGALKRNKTLLTLDLSSTRLGDASGANVVRSLEAHPSLRCLSLAQNELRSGAALSDLVLNCATLRTLNVSANPLSDRSVLLRKLLYSTSLRELNLSRTGITAEDVPFLCSGLSASRIIALDVSCNKLTDAAVALLSPSVCTHLRYLNVASTALTQKSARAVSAFIEDCPSLSAICLDRNTCVDPVSLSDVFTRNRDLPIKALSMGYTQINEQGLLMIAHSLREYVRLQSLVFDGLGIHSNTFRNLADAFLLETSTRRMTQLSVCNNPISDLEIVTSALRDLFKRNPRLGYVSAANTLMGHNVRRITREEYGMRPQEPVRYSSVENADALHDEAYAPSGLFHGVSAVDEDV